MTSHLTHGRNRRRTAAALHIHPNTIDYRLRRIVELTGIDLTNDTGRQLIIGAVAARRAEPDSHR